MSEHVHTFLAGVMCGLWIAALITLCQIQHSIGALIKDLRGAREAFEKRREES